MDTIRYFQEKFPEAQLFLLIGSDQAAAFTRWKFWEEILHAVQLCIARRPHTLPSAMEKALTFQLTQQERSPIWITAPIMEISSTNIRQRIAVDASVHYLIPQKVEEYIHQHKLYRGR
jgi:nicotinate-nucleotide adenylyltransferase